jgi:hypothetical protein
MTKIAGSGSGSISQRHGFADPDPPQNVMDPQHWSKIIKFFLSCNFFWIFGHQNPGSGSGSVSQWIRIQNTEKYGTCTKIITNNYLKLYFNEWSLFSLYLHRSFMVSLMAFSGATPSSWGTRPRYRPVTPSCLTTWVIFIHSFKVNVQAFINFWNHSFIYLDSNSLLLLSEVISSFTVFKRELTWEKTHSA